MDGVKQLLHLGLVSMLLAKLLKDMSIRRISNLKK